MIWFRYHWAELAGVTAPTVAAFSVSPWFGTLTVLAAGSWVRHELQHRIPPIPPPTPDNKVLVARSSKDETA